LSLRDRERKAGLLIAVRRPETNRGWLSSETVGPSASKCSLSAKVDVAPHNSFVARDKSVYLKALMRHLSAAADSR
jgi:hypothetical protein